MTQWEKTRALILLAVLIAIGGIVMYGKPAPHKTIIPRPSYGAER